MKKIYIAITALFLTTSCSYKDQTINLAFNPEAKNLKSTYNKPINVVVTDNRLDKRFVGKKTLGENSIALVLDQNLPGYIQKKLTQSLSDAGFVEGKSPTLEIKIKEFKYNANRKFFIGDSRAEIKLKASVKKGKSVLVSKSFDLDISSKHFIMPLRVSDKKVVNVILKESLDKVLEDEMIRAEIL